MHVGEGQFLENLSQLSRSVVSDSLQPHGLQHTRLSCPSPTTRAYSNSCPLSRWCHPTISSSVVPFSSCPLSLPASGSFPMSQFFTSGGQSSGGLKMSCREGNGNQLQYSCLENPMERGAWQATVHRVAESQTWLSDLTEMSCSLCPRWWAWEQAAVSLPFVPLFLTQAPLVHSAPFPLSSLSLAHSILRAA